MKFRFLKKSLVPILLVTQVSNLAFAECDAERKVVADLKGTQNILDDASGIVAAAGMVAGTILFPPFGGLLGGLGLPSAGESQNPPIIPSQRQENAPSLHLPPLPPGWQYDPKYNPPPPPPGLSLSMTEAQARGVVNAANGIIPMIGNHAPSPAEIEYQQVNNAIVKQRQDRAELEEKTRQMMEEAKKAPVDTLPPTEEFVRKTLAEMAAEQRVRLSINPDTIPDPEESQLPYPLQAPEGQFRNELMRTYKDLHKIDPKGRKQQRSKEMGLLSVREADQSFIEGDHEQAQFWKSLAKEALELAIGLNPTTGFVQSMYELVVGKSIVTSDDLSTTQRAFAFLGVVSLGGVKSITVTGSIMNKVYRGAAGLLRDRAAMEVAVREAELLVQKAGNLIEGWQKGHKIVNIHTAEHINQSVFPFWQKTPPFQLGSNVVEGQLIKSQNSWVRLHHADNQVGGFVMRKSSIEGLNVAEIRSKYAIPNSVELMSEFHPPVGAVFYRGNIQDHGAGLEGAIQYFFKDPQPEWFLNTRSFK